MKIRYLILAAGVALIVVGTALASVTGRWQVNLIRGSTSIANFAGETENEAWQRCIAAIPTTWPQTAVYACQTMRYYATVTPDPVTPPRMAMLSWTPPTRNTDGSTLNNLAGYRIHYGQSPTALSQTIQIANPGVTAYTVQNLAAGTWYFAVRAYSSVSGESDPSNVVSKTVQ